MSNQESESDYNEQESQEPEMDFNQFKHLQTILAKMKIGQLIEGVDYELATIEKEGKRTKKSVLYRSGIQKLCFAFEVSTEIVGPKEGTRIILHAQPDVLAWLYIVRASFIWPKNEQGQLRWAENNGSCSSNEQKSFGKSKNNPIGRPVHDVLATALTRANGRAVTDLLGGGLTSAEITVQQLQESNSTNQPLRTTPNQLPAPQTNFNPLPTHASIKQNQSVKLRTS